ncbi:hypothetical protein BC332_21061 [Capsicum chinense]|nr:hypothetical protein BC332_21061 [Capsicum chinense]
MLPAITVAHGNTYLPWTSSSSDDRMYNSCNNLHDKTGIELHVAQVFSPLALLLLLLTGKMTTESQMHDVATTVGANNIASSSRTNAPPTMAPAEKPKKFSGIDFKWWNYILSGLQDDLYNVYSGTKTSKELWGALEWKYKTEDAGIKKFLVARFLDFKMIDYKSVVSQV